MKVIERRTAETRGQANEQVRSALSNYGLGSRDMKTTNLKSGWEIQIVTRSIQEAMTIGQALMAIGIFNQISINTITCTILSPKS